MSTVELINRVCKKNGLSSAEAAEMHYLLFESNISQYELTRLLSFKSKSFLKALEIAATAIEVSANNPQLTAQIIIS